MRWQVQETTKEIYFKNKIETAGLKTRRFQSCAAKKARKKNTLRTKLTIFQYLSGECDNKYHFIYLLL